MKTTIVILTRNEESLIGKVIDDLLAVLKEQPELEPNIFLWDDSTDKTSMIALEKGIEVYTGRGRGLGWSYYEAMDFIRETYPSDIVITFDGDGQVDLRELPLFLEKLHEGYDMVVGSRFKGNDLIKYKYPSINYWGVKILSLLISIGTFQRFTDSHGGLRVMKFPLISHFTFLGGHSYVQETIISAAQAKFKIAEIPSAWKPRQHGESRVVHSPLKYAMKMALPLALRTKLHWPLFLICTISSLYLESTALALIALSLLALEAYCYVRFAKNLAALKR